MKFIAVVENNSRRVLGLIVLGVLVSGAVYTMYLGDKLRFLPDERNYLTLAQNIALHGKYTLSEQGWMISRCLEPSDKQVETAFRPPGYPMVLVPLILLDGDVFHLRFLNFLFLTATLLFVYLILKRWAGSFAGLLGVAFVVGYPVLFFTAGTFYPQTLGSFLFLAVIYLLLAEEPTLRKLAGAGFLLGVLVLTIPQFLFTLPVFATWLIWSQKAVVWRVLGLFVATTLFLVGLWSLRNYLVLGTWSISTNTGFNLALGNSEMTAVNAETDVDICDHWPKALELTEVSQSRFFRAKAVEFVQENRWEAVELYLLKFLNAFNYRNDLATSSETTLAQDLLLMVTYGGLLVALAGRLGFRKQFPLLSFEKLFLFLYVGNAAVTALFFTRIRFRLPFDYLLIIIAALFVDYLFRWFSKPLYEKIGR